MAVMARHIIRRFDVALLLTTNSFGSYGSTMTDVIFLPGVIAPAADRYEAIRSKMPEIVSIAKELEVYSSDSPPSGYSIQTEMAGIDAIADAVGFNRFHLYGHSGGGAISLAYAAARPSRLLSLVVDEPATDFTTEDINDPYWNLINETTLLSAPHSLTAFLRLQLMPGIDLPPRPDGPPPPWLAKRPAGIEAFASALRRHHIDHDRYESFMRPVLFTYGSLSHPRWVQMRDRLQNLFPDFQAKLFEGLHHLNTSHQAEPAQTAELLMRFWNRAEN